MDATKKAQISAMILRKIAEGMTPRDAFDAVLGAGMYEKLASDVYDELRTRAH